jgi:hypothetical protein
VTARLYDGTVAADYYRAMRHIEQRFDGAENSSLAPPSGGQLLVLVDALRCGMLNEKQQELVHALRAGIAAWSDQNLQTVARSL